jgi:hypothetical protein
MIDACLNFMLKDRVLPSEGEVIKRITKVTADELTYINPANVSGVRVEAESQIAHRHDSTSRTGTKPTCLAAGSIFWLRNESSCATLIKFKLRSRLGQVNITDHGKAPIIQDEPLIVEPGCYRRVVLIGLLVPNDNKLDRVCQHSGFQQRDILHNCVIFAITAPGPQSLEWRTPVVWDAPLLLITHGVDGKVDGAVDPADQGTARRLVTFLDEIEQ